MKKVISLNAESPEVKALRAKLERDMKAFKKSGGKVEQVPFGKSSGAEWSFVLHTESKE